MRTAIVETGRSRDDISRLINAGAFDKFTPKNNPDGEPLVGEYNFAGRLATLDKKEDAVQTLLTIDNAYACIKILGYRFDYGTGIFKIFYEFLPGMSNLEKKLESQAGYSMYFKMRLISLHYGSPINAVHGINYNVDRVITVDLNDASFEGNVNV